MRKTFLCVSMANRNLQFLLFMSNEIFEEMLFSFVFDLIYICIHLTC